MENKEITVNPQPTAVIVQPATPVVVEQAGCCCVPSTASGAVKATRGMSIAILLVHIASLALLAFFFWLQWIASLLGIIMSSIVLCSFSKCAYATAAALYTLGAILDVIIVVRRIAWLGSDEFDSTADNHDAAVAFLTVPSAIGAVTCTLGAAFALKAVCNWKLSGAVIGGASPLPV